MKILRLESSLLEISHNGTIIFSQGSWLSKYNYGTEGSKILVMRATTTLNSATPPPILLPWYHSLSRLHQIQFWAHNAQSSNAKTKVKKKDTNCPKEYCFSNLPASVVHLWMIKWGLSALVIYLLSLSIYIKETVWFWKNTIKCQVTLKSGLCFRAFWNKMATHFQKGHYPL